MAFTITEYKFGKYRGLMIVDPVNRHHMDIIPGYGALVARLEMFGLEVLEPIENSRQLEGEHYFRNFWLMPFQNRIRDGQYTFEGTTYQLEINEVENHNASHGFFTELSLKDVQWEQSEEKAQVTVSLSYDGNKSGYPFPFDCMISYDLHSNGTLKLSYQVKNTGEQTMPFSMGWHPYFQLDGDRSSWKIEGGRLTHYLLDDRNLPTGEAAELSAFDLAKESYDHSFAFTEPPYELTLSSDRYALKVSQQEPLSFVQVFTSIRNSMAIEPVSSGIDAFNTGIGLIRIGAGEMLEGTMAIELSEK